MATTPDSSTLRCGFTVRAGALAVTLLCLAGTLPSSAATRAPENTTQNPTQNTTQNTTENVVLVTIDGLRWQEVFSGADARLLDRAHMPRGSVNQVRHRFWHDDRQERRRRLMPFLAGVVGEEGVLLGEDPPVLLVNPLRFSYPGYNELLVGYFDPRLGSNSKTPNPNVTVLEWLASRPGFTGRVAVFSSWDTMSYIVNAERSGIFANSGWQPLELAPQTPAQQMLNRLMETTTPQWQNVRFDSFTFYAALEYLESERPRLLYLSLGEPDDWAHAGRYDRYLASAHLDDRLIAELWSRLQSLPQYRDKTTLIVTTDHGRGFTPKDWTSHGADVAGAERVWIGLLGPAVTKRANPPRKATLAQVAATIAALLGEDYHAAVPQSAPPLVPLD